MPKSSEVKTAQDLSHQTISHHGHSLMLLVGVCVILSASLTISAHAQKQAKEKEVTNAILREEIQLLGEKLEAMDARLVELSNGICEPTADAVAEEVTRDDTAH